MDPELTARTLRLARAAATFRALRDAALPLTDADIAAISDGYPLIREVEPDSCGNRCRLCPRPPFVPGQGRVKYDTWRVTLAYSWKDFHSLSLCDEHFERYQGDAKGLRDAVEAEVAERRAKAQEDDRG